MDILIGDNLKIVVLEILLLFMLQVLVKEYDIKL